MAPSRLLISILFVLCMFGDVVYAQPSIHVFVRVRGESGMENSVKAALVKGFNKLENVEVTADREKAHLYVECTLMEQWPLKVYGLGASIAYHIKDEYYSRPTSDVAQFGEDRMEEVCLYLVQQIDQGFLEALRKPPAS